MGYKVGDMVVYPRHGAAKVEAITERTVKGITREYLQLSVLSSDGLVINVPVDNAKKVGVRDIVDANEVAKVFEILRTPIIEKEMNWSRRYKLNVEKIATGDVNKIAEVVFQSNTWNERDRSSETEQYYVDQMVKAAPEYEKDIREVMRRSDETIEKTDYAETWVRYLKDKGYHVYILSNYATDTLERTEDKLTFLKYVDGAVFSCQVKQIKPEPEIYKTLLGRYHLDPEKSVFLDDRAENCEAARKQGIHAIQFKSFKQAAAELEKLGVN